MKKLKKIKGDASFRKFFRKKNVQKKFNYSFLLKKKNLKIYLYMMQLIKF